MRNPTEFRFAARAIRVQRLRKLFQQRLPRVDREPPADIASPPLADVLQLLLAQPELAI